MSDIEKNKNLYEVNVVEDESVSFDVEEQEEPNTGVRQLIDPHTGVKRGLKTRHISMMALASIIGPGIFIGFGNALNEGGPVGLIIGFIIVGMLVMSMMTSIGEMNCLFDHNFSTLATKFVEPGFGAMIGYYYCLLWVCNVISEYVSLTSVVSYYSEDVPIWGYFLIFFTVFSIYQMLGVQVFGEGEYILSFFKIFLLSGFYLFAIIYAAGGIPGESVGKPNPIVKIPIVDGFKGVANSFVFCALYYSGVEAVSMTASEAKNPRKAIPIAVRQTIFRILFIYIGAALAYGITISCQDPQLLSSNKTMKSPMVIALQQAGWANAGYFVATMVMITAFSSVNSANYIASRQLFHLSVNGQAPKVFSRVDRRGNPYVAIHTCHILGSLSMLSLGSTASVAYNYIVNLAGVATFIVWTGISFTQYRFRRGWIKQGRSEDDLPYKAPWYPYNQIFGVALGCVLCLVQGWTYFVPFDVGDFLDAYILLPLFFIFWAMFKYFKKTKWVSYEDMDFVTDVKHKEIIEDDDAENIFVKIWKNM